MASAAAIAELDRAGDALARLGYAHVSISFQASMGGFFVATVQGRDGKTHTALGDTPGEALGAAEEKQLTMAVALTELRGGMVVDA